MDHEKLAELLFPEIKKTPLEYEAEYPKRDLPAGALVTRLGPSPTGFIHLGNLYGAFADERLAHQSGGIFYLRIEDTDDKRYVEGAVETVIDSLSFFGIRFDEGASKDGEHGGYGPYHQSDRKALYQCFAKELVKKGFAYPCFLTEEEITEIRSIQEADQKNPGIYGEYARCRDMDTEEIGSSLKAGKPYVIRLRSDGNMDEPAQITVSDAIRGSLSMPCNCQDVVILKADGMPTYHFAHVCDDHFMRTTHVIRGEEWLSSLPIHIELFEKLGFAAPIYCHTAVLMKLDENGNKRKLSKRKDPELSLDYYRQLGYHPSAVREYLLTILNSDYEEWRAAHTDASYEDFDFSTEKMSTSGALFDLEKLNSISQECLLKIDASGLAEFLISWAEEFKPEAAPVLKEDRTRLMAILDLGRAGKKPRKDLIYAAQIFEFISYFFDDYFRIEDELPEEVDPETAKNILSRYLDTYDHSDDQAAWFDKIRSSAEELGYAARPKDYKKEPDKYKGHVGHVSTVIRLAVVGRTQSPDVWAIQQILGEEKTRERIRKFAGSF